MSYQTYVGNLKKEIETYVKLGGNIYAPKRQLPYYEKIHTAIKLARKEDGSEFNVEDIYRQCGIKFDRDFNRYEKLLNNLKHCVNGEGFIDFSKNTPIQKEADTLLRDLAIKVDLTPSEYLILMTPYRTKVVMSSGNYIEHLRKGLVEAYPDGIVKNIKREHNDKYEQIRHFQKYSPFPITFDECLEFLGFVNGNSKQTPMQEKNIEKNKDEILEKLTELNPTKEIKSLRAQDNYLYNQVVAMARANDQTVSQWLNANGFAYEMGQNALRLSRFKVDREEHENLLLGLRDNMLRDYNIEKADEFDMFRVNTEIAKRISNQIHEDQKEVFKENEGVNNLQQNVDESNLNQ